MDNIKLNTATAMSNNEQYIIVDLINKEFFKDVEGNVKIFDTYEDALTHCGFYELPNVHICEVVYNYIEE
jgi:hypothetical protein